jgi:hypothetical protein
MSDQENESEMSDVITVDNGSEFNKAVHKRNKENRKKKKSYQSVTIINIITIISMIV